MSIKNYAHKNIPLGKYSQDNYFLYNTEELYSFLKGVYDGTYPYISIHYADLIMAFEQLYKGTVMQLSEIHADDKDLRPNFGTGHYFHVYLPVIHKYIRLSDQKEGYDNIRRRCYELSKAFTPARYEYHADIEQFRSDFRRFETSMDRLYRGLDTEYAKYTIPFEEEEELKEW